MLNKKVLTLQSIPSHVRTPSQQRCANEHGLGLHAQVRCAMNQRNQLEQLCGYFTRPDIANEQLKLNGAGDVVLRRKSPYQDGTTHIVMSAQEYTQRLTIHLRLVFSEKTNLFVALQTQNSG